MHMDINLIIYIRLYVYISCPIPKCVNFSVLVDATFVRLGRPAGPLSGRRWGRIT